jgi:hypothetical protein
MVPSEPRKKSRAKPPGIEPETLRLVAQCRNHYATTNLQFYTADCKVPNMCKTSRRKMKE